MQDEADYPEIMQLPGTFHLEEVKEVQDERAELHDKINRLRTADSQISHIEDAFSTPGSPAAALAAAVTHAFGPAQPAQQHSADIVQTEASHPSPQDLPVSTKPSPVVVPAVAATPKGTVGTPPAPAATATGPADTSVPTATVPASATTVDSAATAPPATPTMPSAPAPEVTAAAASVKPVPSTAIAASAVQASATTAAVPAVSTTGTHRPAQIEAETEEIPMSPASIADSFVHVE